MSEALTEPSDLLRLTLEARGKNALGTPLMRQMLDQLREAGQRPILLMGAGDAFSAGLNLKEVASLDGSGMRSFLELLEGLVGALLAHPGPTVAAVNGHAIAGGCVLARACDHAVATTNPRARIGLNEIAIGLRFPPRTLRAMRHRIPPSRHPAVFLGAGLHRPDEALRLGLVDELADDCEAVALAHLARLAAHPRGAYAAAKAQLLEGVLDSRPGDLDAFMADVVPEWTSPAIKTRIRAILGG